MSYTLSATNFAKFEELSQLIQGKITPDQSAYWSGTSADYLGNYFLVYDFLSAVQTTTSGGVSTPTTDADVNVWLWLRGASQVNQGIGAFSEFIRSYSLEQYTLRMGQPPEDPGRFIQDASNKIASALIADVIAHDGQLPDIRQLGGIDAGETIGSLYGIPKISRHGQGHRFSCSLEFLISSTKAFSTEKMEHTIFLRSSRVDSQLPERRKVRVAF